MIQKIMLKTRTYWVVFIMHGVAEVVSSGEVVVFIFEEDTMSGEAKNENMLKY